MGIHIIMPFRKPAFPPGLVPREDGLVALGGRLSAEMILEAYPKGIFPWTGRHPIPWYSPHPRMILEPGGVVVSRSMRQVRRRADLSVRFDTAFEDVMRCCATIPREGQDGTWITANMVRVWGRLHAMGLAHSAEVWRGDVLVGGLYGLALGRAFFGESMFALEANMSKLALIGLCERLAARGFDFVDCQQSTGHLGRMGAFDIPREAYLARVKAAAVHTDAWHEEPVSGG